MSASAALKRKQNFGSLALFLFFASALLSPASAAEPGPPVEGQVYYSKDDPNWPAARKAIQAAVKEYARLKLELVSIDTQDGYQRLKDAEKKSNISAPGEVTLILGPFHLVDKGELKQIELYLIPLARRLFEPRTNGGRLNSLPEPFAAKAFGPDAQLEAIAPKPEDQFHYFRVIKNKKQIGWVVDAFRETRCPICNDNQFLIAIEEKDLKIVDLEPVREIERYGVPLKADEVAAYVERYKGRKAGRVVTVDGISGATKTSIYYHDMINEILERMKSMK